MSLEAAPAPAELTAEQAAMKARKEKLREQMAGVMAGTFGNSLGFMCQKFGPELVINGLLDLAAGLGATSFPEEKTPGILQAMAVRINDTDWKRHRARMFEAQLGVAKPGEARSEGGIVLPK